MSARPAPLLNGRPRPPRPLRRPATSSTEPAPFWSTTDGTTARLYRGNALDVLRGLPAGSVHCVVTSPPYWGLRDYAACPCRTVKVGGARGAAGSVSTPGQSGAIHVRPQANPACQLCNGTGRTVGMDDQLGHEPIPDCLAWARAAGPGFPLCGACFTCDMVAVGRELYRVLRDEGTFWLNLGDSYTSGGRKGHGTRVGYKQQSNRGMSGQGDPERIDSSGLPGGNLCGVPWRTALALQADGWILRQDVIWRKPSPMPESVKNRCTKAHEYVFLLAKGEGYYCDMDAIKEPADQAGRVRADKVGGNKGDEVNHSPGFVFEGAVDRNKRSVWTISQGGYKGAHFAVFPPELPQNCILAGTSEHGCCPACGAPWRRVTERTKLKRSRPNDYVKRTGAAGTGNSCANTAAGVAVETLGWEPTCKCGRGEDEAVPCTVLDPFCGSGTTLAVALEHGRRGVGVDLSASYLKQNAVPRVSGVLYRRPATAHLVPRKS